MSYDYDLDAPLVAQVPPEVPYCAGLVVPPHVQQWGFVLRPRMFNVNSFTVQNSFGQPVVQVRGKLFSMHAKTLISTMDGAPILEVSRKVMGFHSTHYLKDPSGRTVATARRRLATMRPKIELYAGQAYDKPENLMLTMKGDFIGYRHSCVNARGEVVAKAIEMNPLNFGPTFFDSYLVDVASGVESLFILAMCIISEELHEERQRNNQSQMAYY